MVLSKICNGPSVVLRFEKKETCHLLRLSVVLRFKDERDVSPFPSIWEFHVGVDYFDSNFDAPPGFVCVSSLSVRSAPPGLEFVCVSSLHRPFRTSRVQRSYVYWFLCVLSTSYRVICACFCGVDKSFKNQFLMCFLSLNPGGAQRTLRVIQRMTYNGQTVM